MGIEFKDKIMLYCFREVKYKQGFTTEIWYYLYNALGSTYNAHKWTSGWQVIYQIQLSGIVFWEGEGTNQLFNFFESSNEEIMGKEQKEEVLWWYVGKRR